MFMGAALGGALGVIFKGLFPAITAFPGAYALVGMGAMVAAATHAPLTAVIILFEMTDNYSIILPLMAAAVVALIVSKRVSRLSIYTRKLARAGIHLRAGKDVDVLKAINVRDVMRRDYETVPANMLFKDLLVFIQGARQSSFPVVNADGSLLGVLSMDDLRRWVSEQSLSNIVVAAELCRREAVTITDGETLYTVWDKFERLEVESLPVVGAADKRRLAGLLFRKDAYAAYTNRSLSTP